MAITSVANLLLSDPDIFQKICAHVSNGGSALDLCALWEVQYWDLMNYLRADDERWKVYRQALEARLEWVDERWLREVEALAHVDLTKIFDDQGKPLPVAQWPADVKMAFAGQTDRGLKFTSKKEFLEMVAKHRGKFIERHEITGKLTLDELLAKAEALPAGAVEPGKESKSTPDLV